jgi:hypothetical protein
MLEVGDHIGIDGCPFWTVVGDLRAAEDLEYGIVDVDWSGDKHSIGGHASLHSMRRVQKISIPLLPIM